MRTRWLDEEGDYLPSSRMTRLDLLVIALHYASNLALNTAELLSSLKTATQQHYNYEVDQEEFASEVSQDIETLGDDSG